MYTNAHTYTREPVRTHEGAYAWNEKRSRVEARKSREMCVYINIRGDSQCCRRIYGFFGTPERNVSLFIRYPCSREYLVISASKPECKSMVETSVIIDPAGQGYLRSCFQVRFDMSHPRRNFNSEVLTDGELIAIN